MSTRGINITWTADKKRMGENDYFFSPTFFAEPLENTQWRMTLYYPVGSKEMKGHLTRRATDDGPESIALSFIVYAMKSDKSKQKIVYVKNSAFKKDSSHCFQECSQTSDLSEFSKLEFHGILCKYDSVTLEEDRAKILMNTISRIWNHQPYQVLNDEPTPVNPDAASASLPALTLKEFWTSETKSLHVENHSRTGCFIRVYCGLSIYDVTGNSVVSSEGRTFVFRYEEGMEGNVIRQIIDSDPFKTYCMPSDERLKVDHCGDSVDIIDQLISYLKESNFPDALRESSQQYARGASHVSIASKDTQTPINSSSPKETQTPINSSSSKETQTPINSSRPKDSSQTPINSSSPKRLKLLSIAHHTQSPQTPINSSSPNESSQTSINSSSLKESQTPINSSPHKESPQTPIKSSLLKESQTPINRSSPKKIQTPINNSTPKESKKSINTSTPKESQTPINSSLLKESQTPINSSPPKETPNSINSLLEGKNGTYKAGESSLEYDLCCAYRDGLFSDVTVCAGEQRWPVHRIVLCARSSVLYDMLNNGTGESESGILKLSDVDHGTVDTMLTFMYSDTLPEDLQAESAAKLYSAAHKYQILPLAEQCSAIVKCKLSLLNVGRACILAEVYQDCGLKVAAKDFVCNHGNKIFNSIEWMTFMKDNVEIAAEVMHHVLLHKTWKQASFSQFTNEFP